MLCCGKCFGTEFLINHIKVHATDFGNCSFCANHQTSLIVPTALADMFTPVLDLYELTSEGTSLIDLIREDWGLFADQNDFNSKNVLKRVIEETDFDFDNYKSKVVVTEDVSGLWDTFKRELKHVNRYFPQSFPEHNGLARLLSYASIIIDKSKSPVLYRARINNRINPFSASDMGAPPANLASAGRANPFGISYLYVGSSINTSISELRPHKNETLNIAELQLTSDLKLIDLREPKRTISPFRHNEDELKIIHSEIGLLIKLGSELTKPVSRDTAHLEYLSSQYLCEFIKYEGYDGVIYKSSLGDGDNYAIFDPSKLNVTEVTKYQIDDVNIVFNMEEKLT
jgi:hypothetical protein